MLDLASLYNALVALRSFDTDLLPIQRMLSHSVVREDPCLKHVLSPVCAWTGDLPGLKTLFMSYIHNMEVSNKFLTRKGAPNMFAVRSEPNPALIFPARDLKDRIRAFIVINPFVCGFIHGSWWDDCVRSVLKIYISRGQSGTAVKFTDIREALHQSTSDFLECVHPVDRYIDLTAFADMAV